MKKIRTVLPALLLSGLLVGCIMEFTDTPESEPPAVEGESESMSPSPQTRPEENPVAEATPEEEPSEPEEPEEEPAGFFASIQGDLALLDGTFADLYARDSGAKLYFSYSYGLYTETALVDYSVVTGDYPDINDWLLVEGELTGPDPGMADRYYSFETGRYRMEDFPIRTVYIAGDDLAALYGGALTQAALEELLGVPVHTAVNEMSGMAVGGPVEVEDYMVEVYFSNDNTVASVGVSPR